MPDIMPLLNVFLKTNLSREKPSCKQEENIEHK